MAGIDRKSNQDVHEVTVKLEPREFCTESTEKVSKFDVLKSSDERVGAGEGNKNGVSLTDNDNSNAASGNAVEEKQPANTSTEHAEQLLNNDASKLMDFCTNMRVEANLGLSEASIMSDNSDSGLSDETEYTTAAEIAHAGTPVPSIVVRKFAPAVHKPKTPGAKWTRHRYVTSEDGKSQVPLKEWQFLGQIEPGKTTLAAPKPKKKTAPKAISETSVKATAYNPPGEKSPARFKKILPKILPRPVDENSSPVLGSALVNVMSKPPGAPNSGDEKSEQSSEENVVIKQEVNEDIDLSGTGTKLAEFCTNIKVEPEVSTVSRSQSTDTPSATGTVASGMPINTRTPTVTSNTNSVVISANPVHLNSTPNSVLNASTHNLSSLPRPPNKFQYHWMNVYHWLEYDTEKHAMFCSMCKKLKKMNPLATERGCTNFKTCTLKRHEESKEHKEAILYYAQTNQAVIVDRGSNLASPVQNTLNTPVQVPGKGITPSSDNRLVGVLSQSNLGGLTNVLKGVVKRNAEGKVVTQINKPRTVNDFIRKVDRTQAGYNFKIVPQNVTTVNSGGAPVMFHKLVPQGETTAAEPQQVRNYSGFRMAYYMAKEQLPIKSAENIVALVNYPPFHSWRESVREQMFNDMHHCISTTIRKVISAQLSRVTALTIILEDGGEAKTGDFRWLLVHVRYVYQKKVYVYTLHLEKLHEMSSDELISVIIELLLKYRIHCHKVVGLEVGSDKDGIITHILPQVIHELSRRDCRIVSVHTSGSVQLFAAVSNVSQRIPALQRYESFIGMIFDYYDSAANRTIEIPLLREHLDEQTEEVADLRSMPWLSCTGTVKVIYLVWPALVEALQVENEEEAQDLLKIIKQYTFVALTHFFMDFLPIIQWLQETSESERWNSSAIYATADMTIESVEALQDNLGVHERQFFEQFDEASGCFSSVPLLNHQAQQQEAADIRNEFLRQFLIELRGRFPSGFDPSAKEAFQVVNPKILCEIDDKESLGLPQMSTILQKLRLPTTSLQEEFQWMVDQATKQFSKATVMEFCTGILGVSNTPSSVSNVNRIMECLLVLPGFHEVGSNQITAVDHLKTLLKLDLGQGSVREERMMNRLFILLNGPPIDRFDYEKAYLQWIDMYPDKVSDNELQWKMKMTLKK